MRCLLGIISMLLIGCRDITDDSISIELLSATIYPDSAIYTCVSIKNLADSAINIYPPSIGKYLAFTEYRFASNTDTLKLHAAIDMDIDTVPSLQIKPGMKYTFIANPSFFGMWMNGISASEDMGMREKINNAIKVSVNYYTGWNNALQPDADAWDSVMLRKYDHLVLSSSYIRTSKFKVECDTGISKIKN